MGVVGPYTCAVRVARLEIISDVIVRSPPDDARWLP